ncbi:hypothetical protein GWI33_007885 [Rhynchophorus ferrugineus]|uniref:Uncharacterized protein n=1 Tax=Rhynchophorus ferrugineus TaxID=354439 RepID=A0A834MCM8_RHYFE|nr:hypothetical protein GWI33_007885 [Rhynchophorus ferrugineus]
MILLLGFVFLLSFVDISSSQPYQYPENGVVSSNYPYWLQPIRKVDVITPIYQNERRELLPPLKNLPGFLLSKVVYLVKHFFEFLFHKLKNLLFHSAIDNSIFRNF